jgi:hypothetical protein
MKGVPPLTDNAPLAGAMVPYKGAMVPYKKVDPIVRNQLMRLMMGSASRLHPSYAT